MLAYVFWHTPRSGIEQVAYAAALLRFHAALSADPPKGFIRSFSTRTSRLPWLAADVAYEDWYLIDDSTALDPLNVAAVDARRRDVHDDAARATQTGAGGLYRLLRGEPIIPLETAWFAKPDGTTYTAFAPLLDVVSRSGATLWQRQMVLGPAPEYAAQSHSYVEAVAAIRIVHTELS